MANNIDVKDASGATRTVKSTETGGVNTPHHNVDAIAAGENHLGDVGSYFVVAGGSFNRPADTTAYAAGDTVANATTAGSCTPITLAVARGNDKRGEITRARLKVNDAAWLNATMRVHLYRDSPTFANGDNGAWSTTESGYLGAIDILLDRQFSDPFATGIGQPHVGTGIVFEPSSGTQNIYAVLETRSAVTPASAKTFTLVLEGDGQ